MWNKLPTINVISDLLLELLEKKTANWFIGRSLFSSPDESIELILIGIQHVQSINSNIFSIHAYSGSNLNDSHSLSLCHTIFFCAFNIRNVIIFKINTEKKHTKYKANTDPVYNTQWSKTKRNENIHTHTSERSIR